MVQELRDRGLQVTLDNVVDFFYLNLAKHQHHEVVMGMFLDSQKRLLKCELISEGTVSQAPLFPRDVAIKALAVDSRFRP